MIETSYDVLLGLFQEDKYFWARERPDNMWECAFCKAAANRKENIRHKTGLSGYHRCMIELAAAVIMSNEQRIKDYMRQPPRPVWRGTATLTVFEGGDRSRPKKNEIG